MGKRRRAAKPEGPSGPREVDPSEAKLKVRTYEDVADSEDEYYIEKDRIDFDDEPRSKKLRRQEKEDEFLEPSDEEVFDDNDDESDASEDEARKPAPKAKTKRGKAAEVSDDEEGRQGEDEEDSGWWGSSRKEYYNADNIETEADALEEEAEARRLQQKKLAKMSEADFMFDENEWLAPSKDEGADGPEVVTEVLKDAPVTDDMTSEDKYKLLQARYPEFEYLVDEFQTLEPLLPQYQQEAEGRPTQSLEVVKYWSLGSYVASLASYFAILTSPARDGKGTQKTLDPAELRDHDIMETLMTCREMWLRVKNLKPASNAAPNGILSPPEEAITTTDTAPATSKKKTAADKQAAKDAKAKKKRAAEKAKQAQVVEESLADLTDLLKKPETAKTTAPLESASRKYAEDDSGDRHSDFGEEDVLDARTAADKAQRKKSLKFYTSQIVQKASRRADAGRDAGGDADIPYRERLRDRQARLNAEAENRGRKTGKPGTALGEGGSDDEEDKTVATRLRDDADEYYDLVAQKSKQRKQEKEARFEAVAAAKRGDRVVEQEVVGEDGKRRITYAIDKNKGLAPRRKKEVRNPRVKKRMQYADKQKKLSSMKAVYKGGEGRGGYQGELSGIKTGLVKSRKL